jgi:hypothetical protein
VDSIGQKDRMNTPKPQSFTSLMGDLFSASNAWKAASLLFVLVITVSAFFQGTYRAASASPESIAIQSLIRHAPQVLLYLLTNGTLIVSSESMENIVLPGTLENVTIKVMSPKQIQDLADSTNYFYYLKIYCPNQSLVYVGKRTGDESARLLSDC